MENQHPEKRTVILSHNTNQYPVDALTAQPLITATERYGATDFKQLWSDSLKFDLLYMYPSVFSSL
jgi:hypothetical protein